MTGSTSSFLSGTALCVYAVLSYFYRSGYPLVAVIILTVVGIGVIVAGLFQMMIERWGIPLDQPTDRF